MNTMTEEGKEIINVMKEMFGTLNNKIDVIGNDVSELKQRVTKIETTLENETNRNIRLLAEGLTPLPDKVNRLSDDMEVVKFDVDIVKKVVTTHSSQIDKLKQAK